MKVLLITQSRMAAKSHKSATDLEQNKLFTIIFITSIVLGIVALSSLALTSSRTTKSEAATRKTTDVCRNTNTIWGTNVSMTDDKCALIGACFSQGKVSDKNSPCKTELGFNGYCCRSLDILIDATKTQTCVKSKKVPVNSTCGSLNPMYSFPSSTGFGQTAELINCCTDDNMKPYTINSTSPSDPNSNCGLDQTNCNLMNTYSSIGVATSANAFCFNNNTPTVPNDDICVAQLDYLKAITGKSSCQEIQKSGLSYRASSYGCFYSAPNPLIINNKPYCIYVKDVTIKTEVMSPICQAAQTIYGQ